MSDIPLTSKIGKGPVTFVIPDTHPENGKYDSGESITVKTEAGKLLMED